MRGRPAPPDLRQGEKVRAYAHVGSDGAIVPNLNRKARRKRDREEARASAALRKKNPGFAERQKDIALAIAMGEMGAALRGMHMRQALGPEVLEELRVAAAADPAAPQPHLEKFAAALERMADDDAREKCRLILGAFFGPPPAWMVDFANGGSVEAAKAAMHGALQDGRIYGKGSLVVEHGDGVLRPRHVGLLADIESSSVVPLPGATPGDRFGVTADGSSYTPKAT